MGSKVQQHYSASHSSASGQIAETIAGELRAVGKYPGNLKTADLEAIDEFHVRGRKATLELAARMEIKPGDRVLDVGSGLGGPARSVAEAFDCHVTGVDLTADFCDAASKLSGWVGLSNRVSFKEGDATALDFEPKSFDAAMTIHAAMNIAAKDAVYAGVHRVLKRGCILCVYDILQGEGGDVLYPVPWARDSAISHLATPVEMRRLLEGAGFVILEEVDSTEESGKWFEEKAARMKSLQTGTIGFRLFLGDDYSTMASNQVRNLSEGRIRTVMYVARS